MAGIAQLARDSGFEVTGCDQNVYPPMSTLLDELGIPVLSGYLPEHIDTSVDQVVIGNALSRGNDLVEHVLSADVRFTSGPQWLHDHFLFGRHVLAVAGTHGKTTTSSLLAWILEYAALDPGFLIGGRPGNFDNSARTGSGKPFVIEADEYDTAFFDKRSKFVHYRPSVAILNNLEFDHADIFADLEQIKTQFHHLVRIVPGTGQIVVNQDDENLRDVLARGCWSEVVAVSLENRAANWSVDSRNADDSGFDILHHGKTVARVEWEVMGEHNLRNALMAIAAAHCVGVSADSAAQALVTFIPPDRRLQRLFTSGHHHLYEDFAHHPTAIRTTLETMRRKFSDARLIAVIEPRSNTMREGRNNHLMSDAISAADETHFYVPEKLEWDPHELASGTSVHVHANPAELLDRLELSRPGNTVIICMSNGSFDNVPNILKEHLEGMEVE